MDTVTYIIIVANNLTRRSWFLTTLFLNLSSALITPDRPDSPDQIVNAIIVNKW